MKRLLTLTLSVVIVLMIVMSIPLTASALDDTYRFDDFKMNVKVPKNYLVITRDSSSGDPAFSELGLDYNETLTAFRAADIYLRAYDPDGVFTLSLTVITNDQSKAINNYSELSDADRKVILDNLQAQSAVSSASVVKRGSFVYFDTSRTSADGSDTLYISQCNTIVNGLQIDISIQKPSEEVTAEEAKVLTNLASSLSFDSIILRSTGPQFDWWRVLLWAVILVLLSLTTSFAYKKHNAAKRRRLEERRARHAGSGDDPHGDPDARRPLTFDEALGYEDGNRYDFRSEAALDAYDINVRNRDSDSGISYFEDSGESIDNKEDYFDTYFKEPTRTRSGLARLMSTVGAYIGIFFRHLGYFFKNLFSFNKRK